MIKEILLQAIILIAILYVVCALDSDDFVCRKLSGDALYGDKRLKAKTEIEGPPGEKGENGTKGDKGEKGEPGASGGQMDYERFNSKIKSGKEKL